MLHAPLVGATRKTAQLQIRISPRDKARLTRSARRAGKDVSSYVLDAVLPPRRRQLEEILGELIDTADPSYPLAALNDFIAGLSRGELVRVFAERPELGLDPLHANLLAAMVEHAAGRLGAPVPRWTAEIEPLPTPYFATSLVGLRMHLLTSSPPAFRRRNLFVDATVGDRV